MKKNNMKSWIEKTENLNINKSLSVGLTVKDCFGSQGVIVKIIPETDDFHGVIYVWQSEKLNYGDDNCEHYSYQGWKRMLRIIDDC